MTIGKPIVLTSGEYTLSRPSLGRFIRTNIAIAVMGPNKSSVWEVADLATSTLP
ncbi:MAG: hypothetical protein WA364_22715 [Candidatus Nitrosopolaris sp.]